MSSMPNLLGDEAAALIKEAQEYLTCSTPFWIEAQKQHCVLVDDGTMLPMTHAAAYFARCREEIISKIIKHLFAEVAQSQYSGGHGSRNTYNKGCRGLLCRRANREELRTLQGQNASARFAVPDELLDEAESRIRPEEVVGHIRYADKVVASA